MQRGGGDVLLQVRAGAGAILFVVAKEGKAISGHLRDQPPVPASRDTTGG
jgi:hypothetical protein